MLLVDGYQKCSPHVEKGSACIVLLLVFWMEGCMGDLFRESGYYFAPTTIQVSLKAD